MTSHAQRRCVHSERGRFELPRRFHVCSLSKRVHSTTLPPLRGRVPPSVRRRAGKSLGAVAWSAHGLRTDELFELLFGQRPAEEVALRVRNPAVSQEVALRLRFDAFCDDA